MLAHPGYARADVLEEQMCLTIRALHVLRACMIYEQLDVMLQALMHTGSSFELPLDDNVSLSPQLLGTETTAGQSGFMLAPQVYMADDKVKNWLGSSTSMERYQHFQHFSAFPRESYQHVDDLS